MLVLTRADVEELLDLDALVDALADAHAKLSAGGASLPPRVAAFSDAGLLGAMPGYVPGAGLGAKLVSLFPQNRAPLPTHQAAIVLFDPDTGMVTALMDGTYITAMRTAGAAALATRLLARDDARVLAIVGTGVQARAAREMFPRVHDFGEIRMAGRGEVEDAVRGADVVAAATHAPDPVVLAEWLAPGTHVSSVGYNTPGSELDPAIVARAAVVCVESRESAFAPPPAGAPELAAVDPSSAVELGELVAGTRAGRTNDDEITLYKSVGVAVQDLAAAALVLAAAKERGVGLDVSLEEVHV
jgi:ornithine cyclodeaminase/alanine dehydrogenase-like protein (mu-crystallin family)